MNFSGLIQSKAEAREPQTSQSVAPETSMGSRQAFGEALSQSMAASHEAPHPNGTSGHHVHERASDSGGKAHSGEGHPRLIEKNQQGTSSSANSQVRPGEDTQSEESDLPVSSDEDLAKDENPEDKQLQDEPLLVSSLVVTVPLPAIVPIPLVIPIFSTPAPASAGGSDENGKADGEATGEGGAVAVSAVADLTGNPAPGTLASLTSKLPKTPESDSGSPLPQMLTPAKLKEAELSQNPQSTSEVKASDAVQLENNALVSGKLTDLIPTDTKDQKESSGAGEIKEEEKPDALGPIPGQEKATFISRIISAAPKASGTPAATSGKSMSIEDKQNEFAATDKQLLPKASVSSKGTKIDSKHNMSSFTGELDLTKLAVSQQTTVEGTAFKESAAPLNIQKTQEARLANLTKLISTEVTVMHQFRPDKLEVVLRPDSQTQILLQLNLKDGKIDGTARCEKGDFMNLSTHWADLQRTMEGQGVRLAPLRESGSVLYSGQNSYQDSSHSGRQWEGSPQGTGSTEARWSPAAALPKAASLEAAVLGQTKTDQLLQMWV